jgi:hypothetical protein
MWNLWYVAKRGTELIREEPVPVPLCPPQMPYESRIVLLQYERKKLKKINMYQKVTQ